MQTLQELTVEQDKKNPLLNAMKSQQRKRHYLEEIILSYYYILSMSIYYTHLAILYSQKYLDSLLHGF